MKTLLTTLTAALFITGCSKQANQIRIVATQASEVHYYSDNKTDAWLLNEGDTIQVDDELKSGDWFAVHVNSYGFVKVLGYGCVEAMDTKTYRAK